jgi:TolA-binding protein
MTARNTYILLAALALASALACGDEVAVKGLTYRDAKITGIEDGQLVVEINGQTVHKPLESITKVTITGQESLNEAEGLASKGKAADAVKAYDQAVDRADVDWIKQLAVIRRLKALGQAPDLIDRAVTEWLALLDQTKEAKFAVSLRPTKPAAKGSKANEDAIVALEAKEKALGNDSPSVSEMRGLLADLYRIQGEADKAKAMALKMDSGKPAVGQTPVVGDSPHAPAAQGANPEDILKTAKEQIDNGGAEQALSAIKGAIQQFTVADLPKALMLMGKAQTEMAKSAKGEKAKELRMAAGLNFMRIVTFYPTITEFSAEAGYLAGKVNLEMGNRAAARAAFNRVVSNYSGSPFAAEAAKAVGAMEKK